MPYKDLEKRKEYQRKYQRKWRQENKEKWKEIREKSDSREERKEYQRKWQKESPKAKEIKKRFKEKHPNKTKEYSYNYVRNNPEKNKEKMQRYNKTSKGRLNRIKKVQNRRDKFKKIAGVYYNVPTKELIELVDGRDKVCVYCGCEFSEDYKSKQYASYDHLDAFKEHSLDNTVKCCKSCNSSKGDKDVLVWLKEKGIAPQRLILNLLKKQQMP